MFFFFVIFKNERLRIIENRKYQLNSDLVDKSYKNENENKNDEISFNYLTLVNPHLNKQEYMAPSEFTKVG